MGWTKVELFLIPRRTAIQGRSVLFDRAIGATRGHIFTHFTEVRFSIFHGFIFYCSLAVLLKRKYTVNLSMYRVALKWVLLNIQPNQLS